MDANLVLSFSAAVADGRGLAAHYSFYTQSVEGGMRMTDALERYRAFAAEYICTSEMLWEPSEEDDGVVT